MTSGVRGSSTNAQNTFLAVGNPSILCRNFTVLLIFESASHINLPAGLHQLFVEWHLQNFADHTWSFFRHQPYNMMWDPNMSRDVKGAISCWSFTVPGLGLTAVAISVIRGWCSQEWFDPFCAPNRNGREFLPWPLSQLQPQKTKKLFPGLHQGRIQKMYWSQLYHQVLYIESC